MGFLWGLGYFTAGLYWIIISLHDYGGMPMPLALLALLGLAAYCALFPTVASGMACFLFTKSSPVIRLLAFPSLWTLSEWFRSWVLTGFPWLSLGDSQTPTGPFSGITPILGVFGTTWILSLLAVLISFSVQSPYRTRSLWTIVFLVSLGFIAKTPTWTHKATPPMHVTLLQGNFTQDQKFNPTLETEIVTRYNHLIEQSQGQLILLPESAMPFFWEHFPESEKKFMDEWGTTHHADILMGVFLQPDIHQYYNSATNFGPHPRQFYRKAHLVPFGEFIPWPSVLTPFIHEVLNIPLDSQQQGAINQPPFILGPQKIAINICYESAFGDEIRGPAKEATILANFSNDAWFGLSIQLDQHLQLGQTRALETGRPLLQVTNTGITAIVGADGSLLQEAPSNQTVRLEGTIEGYQGMTPFLLWGNKMILSICSLCLVTAGIFSLKVFNNKFYA